MFFTQHSYLQQGVIAVNLQHIDMQAVAGRYDDAFYMRNERPVFNISYELGKNIEMPPAPPTIRERWFNFDWRLDCFERRLENHGFMLEGFPNYLCNLGPDVLAGFTGSELVFESEQTSWAQFRVADWHETPPIRFMPEGFFWQQMQKFLKLSVAHGKGRWLTASGDLHTNADG
ncbi:MAG: hypothetical protein PHT43_08085, partial [Anaerolineaceae bacterium]|nr:hypothetical protein [Anaerolineaceae bacterium]